MEPVHNDDDTSPAPEPSRNPVLHENPWFIRLDSFQVPLRVGEAADAAFSTRIRQIISETTTHPHRLSYPTQEQIIAASEAETRRPSFTQARFLIQTTLANLDKSYHIVRRSSLWALLDRFVEAPASLDLLSKSKIYALLALGEVYSSRCEVFTSNVPGLGFFSLAFKAYGYLLERPCLDSIETSLLLVSAPVSGAGEYPD